MKFFIDSACGTVDLIDHFGGWVVDLELLCSPGNVEALVVDQVDQKAAAFGSDGFVYFWHCC